MSRRMEIELTSDVGDGTWTWRAAGAKEPKGVLDGHLLPSGSSVGDGLRVEVDQEIDGLVVISVVPGRQKNDRREMLELLGSDEPFEPVTEKRVARRGPGGDRRRGDRRDDRRDDRRGDRRRGSGEDGGRGDRRSTGERPQGDGSPGGRPRRDRRDDRRRDDRRRDGAEGEARRSGRGSFTPPPDVPARPKPRRLKPGRRHRDEVLDSIPAEQRPIAEVAADGLPAVRQRLADENRRLAAEGKPTMPEDAVVQMAERLIPRLRLAEWLDRADAALESVDSVDLRDLRSVVAAATDPIVARDSGTRAVAEQLQAGLARRQAAELELWYADIDAALAVGRVIRALRLSSQPPKAGQPFPPDLAKRLALGANAALVPTDAPERWIGVLEAAAFSPIRALISVARPPEVVSDDLRTTVTRLGPALPQVAAAFEIEVPTGASMPRPLRPDVKARPPRAARTPSGATSPTETPAPAESPTATPAPTESPTAIPAPPTSPDPTPTATAPTEDD